MKFKEVRRLDQRLTGNWGLGRTILKSGRSAAPFLVRL